MPTQRVRPSVESTLPWPLRLGIPALLFLAALLFLGADLGNPPQIVFDEAHYVKWGREIANGHVLSDFGDVRDLPVNFEHPPLGKHFIAWSLRANGAGQLDLTWPQYHRGCDADLPDTETPCEPGRAWEGCDHPNDACRVEARAWRLPGLVIGASAIVAAYLLGLRLFNSLPAGLFAAALLLFDNLWFLQTRMAMLDIYAAGLGAWAFAFALGPRAPHRIVGGLFLGLAIATKYTALFLVPPFLLIVWLRANRGHPALRTLAALGQAIAIPTLAVVAAYGPYLARWTELDGIGYAVRRFLLVQTMAFTTDFGFQFSHDSASAPWTWVPHLRPTFYYWPTYPDYQPPLIYAVGNLALWWTAAGLALLIPFTLGTRWLRTSAPQYFTSEFVHEFFRRPFTLGPARQYALAALLILGTFAPWFLLQRTQFNYYATLNVPYFALVVGGVLAWFWHRNPRGRTIAIAAMAAIGGWGLLWWPLVSGADVPKAYFDFVWDLRPTPP